MANAKLVRLSRNSHSTNEDLEESLIEIKDEERSSTQLLEELGDIKKHFRLFNLLKYAVGGLLLLILTSFLFAYFIHQKELKAQNNDVTIEENKLKTSLDMIKNLSVEHNNAEQRIRQLEEANKNTIKIATDLETRQNFLDKKLGQNRNITHKHLKIVEDKWSEMYEALGVFEAHEANSTPMLSIDEFIKQSFVYQWNVTMEWPDAWGRKNEPEPVYSEVFTIWSKFRARLRLGAVRSSLSVSIELLEYNNTVPTAIIEKMPKMVYIIQNYNKTLENVKTAVGHCDFNQKLVFKQILYNASLENVWWDYSLYASSADVGLKLMIEPQQMAENVFSNNGILYWRLDNYKRKKQLLINGKLAFIESPYFYTSPQGYKLQMLLQIHYTQLVAVAVPLYCGAYDSSLPAMNPYQIRITIFNQENPTKNYEFIESSNSREATLHSLNLYSWVYITKASYLEANGFLKDDSLLFKLVIEPISTIEELE
ncbi:hypothetical protein CHUAL_001732 [Chamberlinius hualienensis]